MPDHEKDAQSMVQKAPVPVKVTLGNERLKTSTEEDVRSEIKQIVDPSSQ